MSCRMCSCASVPALARIPDTDPSFILLDILPESPDYPGNVDGRPVEIGRLRLRIAEDAKPGEMIVAPAFVPVIENGFEVLVESGGNAQDLQEGSSYSPARGARTQSHVSRTTSRYDYVSSP